ncbi:MAG: putative toxin-antitoxin system toxin component, PIN family [Gammaproteobacteria bacterium]
MSLPVFVVDTNVIVAGLITGRPESPVAVILDAMLKGALLYLLPPDLVNEYRVVLSRPRLCRFHGLHEDDVSQLLMELTANAIWREPDPGAQAPDPGDHHLWALLDAHPGSVLITGDRRLVENPPAHRAVITPQIWYADFAPRSSTHDN